MLFVHAGLWLGHLLVGMLELLELAMVRGIGWFAFLKFDQHVVCQCQYLVASIAVGGGFMPLLCLVGVGHQLPT